MVNLKIRLSSSYVCAVDAATTPESCYNISIGTVDVGFVDTVAR